MDIAASEVRHNEKPTTWYMEVLRARQPRDMEDTLGAGACRCGTTVLSCVQGCEDARVAEAGMDG